LQNKPLRNDWMIDPKTGAAVVDPHKSAEALLLPMAGYKGAGLALTLGLLAGTLNGALFGRDCVDFNAEPDRVTNTGQFVVALDPSRFQPLARFKAEVDRHIRDLRDTKPLPGHTVRLPGEQRAKRHADRLHHGLPLAPELLAQLDKLAGELSIKPLRERM
jgi:L-2-hydroxycarboxylate dehydrogenase (NAD+)